MRSRDQDQHSGALSSDRSQGRLSKRLSMHQWASLRFALGLLQMFGATVGVVLLIGTGLSPATLVTVVITTAATVVSRWLFHGQ